MEKKTKNSALYKNYKNCMFVEIVLILLGTGCTLFLAQYLAAFLSAVSDTSTQSGRNIILGICLILVLQLLFAFLKNRYWKGWRARVTNKFECDIYGKYLESQSKLANESVLSVVCDKDISEVEKFYTETLPYAIQAIAGVILYALFFLSKTDGAAFFTILIVLGLFQFVPPIIVQKYLIQNYIRAGQEEANVRQHILAGLEGITTIKMLNLEKWFVETFGDKQNVFRKVGERAAATSSVQSALNSGVSLLQQIGLLIIGVGGVAWGWFSLETLIEGYILSSSFYQYCANLGAFKAKRGICKAAEGRITDLCEAPDHSLEIKSNNVQITLPKTGCWLIKGENGAGKSTFLGVLRGYLHNEKVVVWKKQELNTEDREKITSWCPQQYMNLSNTFRWLIKLIPEETVDAQKLENSIIQFGVDEVLVDKPLNQLSGGEQKKLMISLALAKRSEILLLDEPEVSLDHASVLILKKLLSGEDRLVLMVTHNSVFDDISDGTILVKEGVVDV